MTAKEAQWAWNFSGTPLKDESEILCPSCERWSPLANWTETDVYCELCGDHSAMRCPLCNDCFDHVHGPTFEVREPQKGGPVAEWTPRPR